MADLFTSPATQTNVKEILLGLYVLDQTKNPDPETVTKVWDWAKGEFAENVVVEIQNEPDKRPYLQLAVKVLEKVNKNHQTVAALPEIVERLKEHQREEQKRADAELAKKEKLHLKTPIKEAQEKVRQFIIQNTPNSTATPILEAAEPVISTSLAFDAPTTTQDVANLIVVTTPDFPDTEIPHTITPLTKEVTVELNPVTGSLWETLTNKIEAAGPKIPLEEAKAAAAEILSVKIIDPEADSQKLTKATEKIVLGLEAKGYQINPIEEEVVGLVSELKLDQPIEVQVETIIKQELVNQGGLDEKTAEELTQYVNFNHIPELAFRAARALPSLPNESPEKRSIRQQNVFTEINKVSLGSYRQIPNQALNQLLKREVDFGKVYKIFLQYSSQFPQYYQTEEYQLQDNQGNSHSNEVVDYLVNQGQDKLSSEAWNTLSNWIKGFTIESSIPSSTGALVGTIATTATLSTGTAVATTASAPIVGIIVGEAAPAWILAGIGHGLMNGTAVYAGTLATGEIMFVAPSSLAAATALITSTGSTTLASTGGAGLGLLTGQTAIPIPVLGAIIGAIVGIIAANFSKIIRVLKKIADEIKNVGVSAAIGAYGIVTGAQSVSQGITLSLGQGISQLFSGMVQLVAIEIVTPIIVIIATIPVVVALLLFIINNSAYVVPPSYDLSGFVPGQGGFQNNASCPVTGGTVHAGSYNPTTQTGHGGNVYWSPTTGVGGTACRYSLPQQSGCLAPSQGQVNVCYQQTGLRRCDFYGFSADVFPPTAGTLAPVYFPQIDGKDATWSYNGVFFPNGGGANGYSYGFTDSTGKYSLLLTHIQIISNPNLLTNITSGNQAAILYNQGGNTHLHIEFQVDGVYQRPENYFCGN